MCRRASRAVLASVLPFGRTGGISLTHEPPHMKRRLALALVTLSAAAGLVAVGASGASATSEFHFYGGGWGHGVGMSQYGAYGMAAAGASYTDILAQYYTGTAV